MVSDILFHKYNTSIQKFFPWSFKNERSRNYLGMFSEYNINIFSEYSLDTFYSEEYSRTWRFSSLWENSDNVHAVWEASSRKRALDYLKNSIKWSSLVFFDHTNSGKAISKEKWIYYYYYYMLSFPFVLKSSRIFISEYVEYTLLYLEVGIHTNFIAENKKTSK